MPGAQTWTVALIALAIGIAVWRRGHDLAEALREAFDNFRGGPPTTPMHPSPAADAVLLLKRRKKARD